MHSTPSDASSALGARTLPRPVQRFLDTEAAGGVVLVAATLVALVWANSPWDAGYDQLWHTAVRLEAGPLHFHDDLRHVVNDGLMALFFLVVGIEVKRELVTGELRAPRAAALPVVAALGGMAVPAGIYLVATSGTPGSSGWGIPMATDIAFALGVLALLGGRAPAALKLFLLTLAVVDDIGAILVIAVAYSDDLDLLALAVAVAAVATALACLRLRVWSPAVFAALGATCWFALHQSGVHATLAGVAFGLIAPTRPRAPADVVRDWAGEMTEEPSAAEMRSLTTMAKAAVSAAERVQHRLHPFTSFAVLPLFALANAGVPLSSDALDAPGAGRVALGVAAGLVVGKVVGITAASAAAVKLRLAVLPAGMDWPRLVGAAMLAGVGFTVSLFIAGLGFDDPDLAEVATLAVLAASVLAAAAGAALTWRATRRPAAGDAGKG